MKKMKRVVVVVTTALLSVMPASAQNSVGRLGVFNHLDAAVTMGTTGLGVDLSAPVGDYVALRTGFAFMPRFEYKMTFGIQVGDFAERKYDAAGNRVETKFDRMAGLLKDITGYDVDDEVDMIGKPSFYNFKLMVDVFPFKGNKHWHVTAGCYWGPSKIADAFNTTEDMPSLMAVALYNNIYDKLKNGDPIVTYQGTEVKIENEAIKKRILNYGRMGMHLGDWKYNMVATHDQGDGKYTPSWFPDDVVSEEDIVYRKGTPYMMEPDKDLMAKASMKVKRFRPYVGVGYGGRLFKNDSRYQVSFDCGVMFWGGAPKLVTHDGTDLMYDVENIGGQVGDYVDIARKMKAYPVLNLRIVRSLF